MAEKEVKAPKALRRILVLHYAWLQSKAHGYSNSNILLCNMALSIERLELLECGEVDFQWLTKDIIRKPAIREEGIHFDSALSSDKRVSARAAFILSLCGKKFHSLSGWKNASRGCITDLLQLRTRLRISLCHRRRCLRGRKLFSPLPSLIHASEPC